MNTRSNFGRFQTALATLLLLLLLASCKTLSENDVMGFFHYETSLYRQTIEVRSDRIYSHVVVRKSDMHQSTMTGGWSVGDEGRIDRIYFENFTFVSSERTFEQHLASEPTSDFAAPAVTHSLFQGTRLVFDPENAVFFSKE